jgi:hypothetical protein
MHGDCSGVREIAPRVEKMGVGYSLACFYYIDLGERPFIKANFLKSCLL